MLSNIQEIKNARYLESGAIDCDVLFSDFEGFLPYTATPEDTTETGQRVWQELQSGKYDIAPFRVTPEILAAARAAKHREIEAWRTEQESRSFTFEWGGHTWNAGADSWGRLYPLVTASKFGIARDMMSWSDAENQPVLLSKQELEELAGAMTLAQVERNHAIYQRQRAMKDKLDGLNQLDEIRAFYID